MGVLAWLTKSIERNLDRRVTGGKGESRGRFTGLVDDADLIVHADIAEGHDGRLELRARPATEDAEGVEHRAVGQRQLTANLGQGRRLRNGSLTVAGDIQADVRAGPSTAGLARLAVELYQQ